MTEGKGFLDRIHDLSTKKCHLSEADACLVMHKNASIVHLTITVLELRTLNFTGADHTSNSYRKTKCSVYPSDNAPRKRDVSPLSPGELRPKARPCMPVVASERVLSWHRARQYTGSAQSTPTISPALANFNYKIRFNLGSTSDPTGLGDGARINRVLVNH